MFAGHNEVWPSLATLQQMFTNVLVKTIALAGRSFCDTSTEAANIYLVKYFVGNPSVMILSITTPNGRLKFEVSSNDIVDIF